MNKNPGIKKFVFNPFQENTYLLYDEASHACVVIDPGCSNEEENEEILSFIKEKKLHPEHVLLTHAHLDHVCGAPLFYNEFGLSPRLHPDDFFLYDTVESQGEIFSFRVPPMPPVIKLEDKTITFGNIDLEVLSLPGHSPGGVAYYHKGSGLLFSGDILFRGSIGRTDLPGGDYNRLINSIREKILGSMRDEVHIFPGHGPETTVGYEALSNPFLDFV